MQQLVFIMLHGKKIHMVQQIMWLCMLNYSVVPMKMLVIFKLTRYLTFLSLSNHLLLFDILFIKTIQLD